MASHSQQPLKPINSGPNNASPSHHLLPRIVSGLASSPARAEVAVGYGGCRTGTGRRRFSGVTRGGIKAWHLAVPVPPALHLGGGGGGFSGDPKNSVTVCRAVEIVGPRNGVRASDVNGGSGCSCYGTVRLNA
ncbi:hypothetical protein PVAP13_9KG110920 [Panicum virgatum]|uniref:Uncharacterized protein n=1 Tax=Panicum virgatum TaxID=38727 RepID=A0A8T0NH71_PANVG|nr:hypothetical protein PVAP13_9KG110920 [Panicum virgatum]